MAYTVQSIDGQKQWAGQHGPMVDYYLTLVDPEGNVSQRVTLAQKPTSNPPTVGQALEGNIDNTQYGLKFKKAFAQGGGGGGGGHRGKSPEEQAAIAASVALKFAVEAVEQAITIGVAKAADQAEHVALVRRYADWAVKYIESKGPAS